jgi:hypothetical protein
MCKYLSASAHCVLWLICSLSASDLETPRRCGSNAHIDIPLGILWMARVEVGNGNTNDDDPAYDFSDLLKKIVRVRLAFLESSYGSGNSSAKTPKMPSTRTAKQYALLLLVSLL